MTGKKELIFCFEDFYPSNIPYNHILKDIIEECCYRGYSVKVITSYKDDEKEHRTMVDFFDKNLIKSSFLKIGGKSRLRKVFFSVHVFFHLLFYGKGTVVVPSTPPVIMGFSVFLARLLGFFRFSYVYHCQDIHPEALVISSSIKNPIITRILYGMDRLTVKYAKKAIVLSRDMESTLLKRYHKQPSNISIINNFIPSAYCQPLISASKCETIRDKHHENDTIFVFAGNIGEFQNLEILLKGFLQLDSNIKAHLYFIGEGKVKSKLVQIISGDISKTRYKVHVLDKMNSKEITRFILGADYGIVSISEGLLDVAYPSKIATYLSLGLPLLLCGGKESGIEKEVNENNLGVSIAGENIETIQEGIQVAIESSIFFRNERQKIKLYYDTNYDRTAILSSFISEL